MTDLIAVTYLATFAAGFYLGVELVIRQRAGWRYRR